MYRLFPGKTPTQMRREAERAAGVKPPAPLCPADPARRPRQASQAEEDATIEAAADWLAHTCPEPVEGSPPAASRSGDSRARVEGTTLATSGTASPACGLADPAARRANWVPKPAAAATNRVYRTMERAT